MISNVHVLDEPVEKGTEKSKSIDTDFPSGNK